MARKKEPNGRNMWPLEDVTIVDMCDGVAGSFGTRLLADYGANIIKAEPPEGSALRRMPPFLNEPGPDSSAWHVFLNAGKKGMRLDLLTHEGRELLDRLLARSEALVIDDSSEARLSRGLQPSRLLQRHPHLLVVSVRPYGEHGPYANYKADNLTLQAMGGMMGVNGDPQKEPLSAPGEQASMMAGRNVSIALMAGLLDQGLGEPRGQFVDLSEMECVLCETPFLLGWYAYVGAILARCSNYPRLVLDGDVRPCKDGHVCLAMNSVTKPWEIAATVFDEPGLLDEKFRDHFGRLENWQELDRLATPRLKAYTKQELFRIGLQEGLPVGPVQTVDDLLACPQLHDRGFFHRTADNEAASLLFPGTGIRFDGVGFPKGCHAPSLGQHNREIAVKFLGLPEQRVESLTAKGIL